jgi:hypothetical protein
MKDAITIGRCKDCEWRNKYGECTNDDKLHENDYEARPQESDHLIYSYYDCGSFRVGPDFGCVHWSSKAQDSTTGGKQ